ncbi:hypothetical protein AVEN_89096-1 [Araneus ventricosus]|uniref:Uncharacterized protein n=1 Tax=Araneus ventricosus TaxID=182803 RepID=A0A4Y2B1S9_ARAVE|nr:hypothetical protein AVEN_89096-1 [Araneus ventricosus]
MDIQNANKPWWPSCKVSASGPDDTSFEIRVHCGSAVYVGHVKSDILRQKTAGAVRKFGGRCQLRCRPGHLTMVQKCEVYPKITLALPLNGTLLKLN